jgi:regulator of chromosome condensation
MDAASDDEDDSDDDESGLNPRESTPTAIPSEHFDKNAGDIVQLAATDSASFALSSRGLVYGWGIFSVSTLISTYRPKTVH